MFEQSYYRKETFMGQSGSEISIDQHMNKIRKKSSFLKWNAKKSKIALIVMLIGFTTLCAFLRFYKFSHYNVYNEENNTTNIFVQKLPNNLEIYSSPVCIPSVCGFTCQNMDGSGLIEAINNVSENLKDCSELKLELNNVKLNESLGEKWLSGVIPEITSLSLKNIGINNLERKAFSGKPFTRLTKLTLENTNVQLFRENVFEDSKLLELSITYNAFKSIEFEENVLSHVSKTLQLLQLQRCVDSTSLENLTGSKAPKMTALTFLELRYNKLSSITEKSFSSVPFISTILLSNSFLSSIDSNSFRNNTALSSLYLENNDLSYLPEGVFAWNLKKVYINNNPWNCSCKFQWFKEFFEAKANSLFSDSIFQCLVRGKFENYKEVDFCQQNENSSASETTSLSSTITSEPPTPTPTPTPTPSPITKLPINPNFIQIACTPSQSDVKIFTQNLTDPSIIKLRNQSITFKFYQIMNQPMYQIQIEGDTSNDNVLWIHSSETDKICKGCYSNLNENFFVENLSFEETYIFCLINQNKSEFSPLDCGGLTVPPAWESQTWLPNKARSFFIGAIIGSILFSIFLTGLIVFYCIRQHPNLIKGNKRVIIVASKAADALVMPRNYDQLNYMPPSMISYSDGYLIPRRSYYEHIRTTPTTEMTSRDNSFRSNSIESEIRLKRNVRRRVHLSNVSENLYADHLYEAPPLPPNHPGENKQNRSTNCMFY